MTTIIEIADELEEMALQLAKRRGEKHFMLLGFGEIEALIHNLEMNAEELRVLALQRRTLTVVQGGKA